MCSRIDFNKYLLPTPQSQISFTVTPQSELASSQESLAEEMPKILFRDYICPGMGRQEDDQLAKKSPIYL